MVYCTAGETVLSVWWDPRSEYKKGYTYKITIDGKNVVYTTHVYYDFKALEEGTSHDFIIQLVDENKNVVGKTETATYKTLPYKEKVDLTKPPYCLVGDGETDITEKLQKAIDECRADQYLFLPFGIYIANKIVMSGDKKIVLGGGAVICTKERAKTL